MLEARGGPDLSAANTVQDHHPREGRGKAGETVDKRVVGWLPGAGDWVGGRRRASGTVTHLPGREGTRGGVGRRGQER